MEFIPAHSVNMVFSKEIWGLVNCFIEFKSIFPISSARVAATQNIATAFESERFCTSILVSGAFSRASYGSASFAQRQYMRCFRHLVQEVENWRKYVTNVEHSFRTTRGPSEVSMHWMSQQMRVLSNALASSSLKDFLSSF